MSLDNYPWGDRLLDSAEFSYGPWDASDKDTAKAIELIDKDIIITDWRYHNWHHFRSVERFAEHGFKIWLSTFNVAENAKLFLDYAKEHGSDNIIGVMETTWVPCKNFMDGMEGKESPMSEILWYNNSMKHIRRTYNWLFRPCEFDPTPIED